MAQPCLLVMVRITAVPVEGHSLLRGCPPVPGTQYGAITGLDQKSWIRPVSSNYRRQHHAIIGADREFPEDEPARKNRAAAAEPRRSNHP